MWKHIILAYCVLQWGGVNGFFNKPIAKGKWVIDKTERCPDCEKYPYCVDLLLSSINETHQSISTELDLLEDITEEDYGISIEACKKTEFGCNLMGAVEDESLCRFLTRNAEENFKEILRNIGAEEHCPIAKVYPGPGQKGMKINRGDLWPQQVNKKEAFYKMTGYVFDNRELPEDGLCGAYIGTAYVTKRDSIIACFAVHVHFDEDNKDALTLV